MGQGVAEPICHLLSLSAGGAAAAVEGVHQVLPSGYWWSLLYATVLLFICFIVCLV